MLRFLALAADGFRFRDFHVNAMCSPTRASLLSGCYHHTAGMRFITEIDMGFPGYQARVRYWFVSITGDMKEKKQFPYTNRIDRVEFDLKRPAGDMEFMLVLEQALRNE